MQPPGAIGWFDLTVADAPAVRDFYAAVVGWTPAAVPMGGYEDYTMTPPGGDSPVAGICHARGVNAGLPACWLMYITVADIEAAAAEAQKRGGTLLMGAQSMGGTGRFCVIRDPAGACCALFEPAS